MVAETPTEPAQAKGATADNSIGKIWEGAPRNEEMDKAQHRTAQINARN